MTSAVKLASLVISLAALNGSVGFTQQANRLPVPFFGAGDQTCAAWSSANQSEAQRMQSWVLGYVSGAVMVQVAQTQMPILPPMDVIANGPDSFQTLPWNTQGLLGWVNRRCADAPADTLNTVATELANRLSRR